MPIPKAGRKSICLPIDADVDYQELVANAQQFRAYLDAKIEQYPELFPSAIKDGYWLHGSTRSKKQQLPIRRLKVLASRSVYQLRPDFMMPYMIGRTEEVERALYLRLWGVSFEGLAYVFGRDESYWYRAYQALGRFSVVGTTVRAPENMPEHLLADEKHSWWWGERVYLPTIVGSGCILGVDLVANTSTEALKEGYQTFKQEALWLDPDYVPKTVNTDGWLQTQQAWMALFSGITVIECFLHVVLGIQRHCRRSRELFIPLSKKLWHLYRSGTKQHFGQRLRRLQEWASTHVESEAIQQKLCTLKQKNTLFKSAYDFPEAYRTSNQLDRLMNYQDRLLYSMQYFHGTLRSAQLQLRAMALVWNFHPYGQRNRNKQPDRYCAFEELNGFRYHDNWLRNLLIAGSMNGY